VDSIASGKGLEFGVKKREMGIGIEIVLLLDGF